MGGTISTTDIGKRAEKAAARQLLKNGYAVHALNWRTKWCEIDIVASRNGVIYLVEVKYRSTASQGSGLAYVTAKKQRQMLFAAELWCAQHNWHSDYELAAIEVGGTKHSVGELVII